MKLKLRDYQNEGIFLIKSALAGHIHNDIEYRLGHQGKATKVLYVLSTGGGKTATYAAIAEGAASKGNRVLILEHRKELIFQASMALGRLGVMHQVIAPPDKIAEIKRRHVSAFGQPFIRPNALVAVASVQTLARRMDWLDLYKPNIIITDEAHHRLAGTWGRIGEATPYAIEIGVTATPCRTNGDGLGQIYQAMVQGPSMGWLVENGFLVPFRVYAPPPKASFDKVHIKAGDYDANELAELLDKPTITGDAISHYMRLTPHEPGIVFCCNIRHATHVAEQFRDAGIKAQIIHGGMDDIERDRLINGLSDRSVELLVSVDLISEGTDLPVAVVAIMLRLTQSLSLYLQMAGRVGRPVYAEGYDLEVKEQRLAAIGYGAKPYGFIIDHVGNVLRHGLPQSEQFWTLEGRRRKKRGPKEEADQAPTDMQCPSCYQIHTVKEGIEHAQRLGLPEGTISCYDCGHIYDPPKDNGPRSREGELKEIVESEEEIERRKERMEQGRAQTREALLAMGMSKSRAEHILQARREKERLQRELRDVVAIWQQRSDRPVVDAFGFRPSEIDKLKPKQLREAIEAISVAMFAATGEAATAMEEVASGK